MDEGRGVERGVWRHEQVGSKRGRKGVTGLAGLQPRD
jgi:hypothetical protein